MSKREPALRRAVARVLAREEPAGERVVDRRVQLVAPREREVLDVELAEQHVVELLRDDRARHLPRVGLVDHLEDLPRGVVRDAPREDLLLLEQLGDGVERLVDRRVVIGDVQVVDVDVVGAEPRQAAVDRLADPRAAQALGLAADATEAALGRDGHLVASAAAPPQRVAHDRLRDAVAVRVGGVDVLRCRARARARGWPWTRPRVVRLPKFIAPRNGLAISPGTRRFRIVSSCSELTRIRLATIGRRVVSLHVT